MTERPVRKLRFEPERTAKYRPKGGSWESVLVGLKDAFPESVFGVGDSDFWEPIEEKAAMNLREAVFQYYLAGKGHLTLAKMVIDSSSQVRAGLSLGTMDPAERINLVWKIADRLYDEYPDSYRKRIKK